MIPAVSTQPAVVISSPRLIASGKISVNAKPSRTPTAKATIRLVKRARKVSATVEANITDNTPPIRVANIICNSVNGKSVLSSHGLVKAIFERVHRFFELNNLSKRKKKTVKNGTHPIHRPLFMYTNDQATVNIKQYIDMARNLRPSDHPVIMCDLRKKRTSD